MVDCERVMVAEVISFSDCSNHMSKEELSEVLNSLAMGVRGVRNKGILP